MGVPHGGVGDEELLLVLHPVPQGLGALLVQELLEAGTPLPGDRREPGDVQLPPLGGGVVHLLLGDVPQDLVGPVLAVAHLEELRGLVDELGVALARPEGGVGQDVGDEGDVGLDAPDVLLPDGPGGPAAGPLEGVVPGGDLHQQGVIVGGDDRPGIGVAAVQPDPAAAAGAVGGDLAGVGGEVVGGVLGGHPALDGVAVDVQVGLVPHADVGVGEGLALGDEDLGPHQVHAGDLLGDGVLHLDAGVHLDKVVVPALVHQELHRAGVDIAHMLGDFHRVGVELLQGLPGHAPGGGELHHLLVAALEGAVPLPQVDHVAVLVSQDLDLDVLGLHQVLLNEDVLVAKGLPGLVLHQLELPADVLLTVTAAHAPAAAAGRRLEDDGEAVGEGLFHRLVGILQGLGGAGNGGHAAGDGRGLGRQLVPHLGQDGGVGPDEGDAGLLAGPGEVGVFREEAVARVDGVHLAALGQVDDGRDVQVGPQGGLVLADQVCLVGPGPEEAVGVLVGVHGHGAQLQVVAGAEDADGDLAPVGDEHLLELVS